MAKKKETAVDKTVEEVAVATAVASPTEKAQRSFTLP